MFESDSARAQHFEAKREESEEVMLMEERANISGTGHQMILQGKKPRDKVPETDADRTGKFCRVQRPADHPLTAAPHKKSLRSPPTSPQMSPVSMDGPAESVSGGMFSLMRTLSGFSIQSQETGSVRSPTDASGKSDDK
jgi:hypothetical protein